MVATEHSLNVHASRELNAKEGETKISRKLKKLFYPHVPHLRTASAVSVKYYIIGQAVELAIGSGGSVAESNHCNPQAAARTSATLALLGQPDSFNLFTPNSRNKLRHAWCTQTQRWMWAVRTHCAGVPGSAEFWARNQATDSVRMHIRLSCP